MRKKESKKAASAGLLGLLIRAGKKKKERRKKRRERKLRQTFVYPVFRNSFLLILGFLIGVHRNVIKAYIRKEELPPCPHKFCGALRDLDGIKEKIKGVLK